MATQEDLFFYISPPSVSSVDALHQVISEATSGSAANWDWVTELGGLSVIQGSAMVTLEALTTDCYVRFKPTTAAAGTTTLNGLLIKADQPGRPFYVNPVSHKVIDMIATGVGTLKLQVSSPIGARIVQ